MELVSHHLYLKEVSFVFISRGSLATYNKFQDISKRERKKRESDTEMKGTDLQITRVPLGFILATFNAWELQGSSHNLWYRRQTG